MRARTAVAVALLVGGPSMAEAPPPRTAVVGGRILEGPAGAGRLVARTVHVEGTRIRAIDGDPAAAGEVVVDVKGAALVPAFVDAHVHVELADVAAVLDGGVGAVVDWGSTPALAGRLPGLAPLRVLLAGQLLTAPGGYPSRSWGRGGYAREVRDEADARKAVREQADRGARVIKLALAPGSGPVPSAAECRAIVQEAHARGLKVGSHALSAAGVRLAVEAGVDVLVHAPTEPLSDELVREFASGPGRAVIPTFQAFGTRDAAVDNVTRLRRTGCRVLYGTDLGNSVPPGILVPELQAYQRLGMSPREIIAAATSGPAAYFGIDGAGVLAAGADASFIAVDGDPYTDVAALSRRRLTMMAGQIRP